MKRLQSIGVLLSLITGLLVLILVSVFANSARQAYERRQDAMGLISSVRLVRDVFAAVDGVHIEQGRLRTALSAADVAGDRTRGRLAQLHDNDRKALDRAFGDLQTLKADAGMARLAQARLGYERQYARAAEQLLKPLGQRDSGLGDDWSASVNTMADGFLKQADTQVAQISSSDPFNNEMMKVMRILQSLRRVAGIGRRMVGEAIMSGEPPSPSMLHDLAELDGRFNEPWAVLDEDANAPSFPPKLAAALNAARATHIEDTRRQRDATLKQLESGATTISGMRWMQISDSGLNALAGISATALTLTEEHVAQEQKIADREFSLALLLMIVSISLASLTALFVNLRVIAPLRSIAGSMAAVGGGDLQHLIPYTRRQDEIGEFARALCLFRDNALDKEHLEEELRHVHVARQSAEASNRIKSEFLANMSHELRTPLNAILGFSDLMKNEIFGPLAAQYREYASLIYESGDHLLNLVSDLLDIAKIEAGRFVLSFQPVELVEVVDYCASLVKRRANEKGVLLAVEVPPAPVSFSADARGLRQILINLLSNAIKFTPKDGRVEMSAFAEGESVRIVVKDSGIGMSESLLSRIGRPFEQASNDPAHAREGTGLGLSLVRAIVGHHGGTLDIQSRENAGTTVTVVLPRSQAARAAA